MSTFLIRKSKSRLIIPERVITFWSPTGSDTSEFCLEVGQELARHTTVAIAEMPCQGIPRLGFISETMERERCVENALQELEKTGYLTLSQLCKKSDNLALLAASVYATPDYPLINRLSLSTLMDYPVKFIHTARQLGYQTILFECQGQLTTPMTFFALKNADYLFITVPKMADLAFTIINIKHLVQTFKMSSGQIFLVGDIDPLSLKDLAVVIDDEGGTLETLTIIRQQKTEVIKHLLQHKERYQPGLREIPLCAEGQNG